MELTVLKLKVAQIEKQQDDWISSGSLILYSFDLFLSNRRNCLQKPLIILASLACRF